MRSWRAYTQQDHSGGVLVVPRALKQGPPLMFEVGRQVARGVDEDQKAYPGREQGIESSEPVQSDGEAQISRRRLRYVHRAPAPVPR